MSQSRGQRIVGSKNEAIGAVSPNQVAQQLAVVRDDIEVKLRYVGRWWSWNRVAAFRHEPISHVESPDDGRPGATCMIQNNSQLWMALEHATVNQQRRGQPGI